ncbi:Fructosamine/Ketosamine-3-kinase [Boletus reticuloceps]|uniref:protein-ribulosamine 3-kinase n=1 Tax=Boletus reticuloceps TaxID=495285 RepID=A0A8I2Z123_9AGAM|nr:Fructosamine/Ketosamine-3-kinase [Boletus reticuloceps]
MPDISSIFLPHLHNIEPDAQFTLNLPIVTSSAGNRYYAKLGNVTESDQYIGEAESLKAIHAAAPGLAPKVFAAGDIGSLSTKPAEILGERIAIELHAFKSNKGYGFDVPTYCGATRQENGWFETWEECYSSMIENLLLKLKGSHGSTELILKGEEVRSRVIPWLLRPLRVEPVLLHGDLWSGNTGVDRINGQPVIFDPSSYFGHNEADLAIARIFWGIPSAFFSSYHKHMPKSEPAEQYDLRGDLYELYHYLNHTVLFGGGYASSALRKMNKLLNDCPQ